MTSLANYKISSSSSAASVIVSNVDMLTQILLYLPVKSLLVFKSVSKRWFFLISDPFFRNKYNLHNSLSIQGLYTQTESIQSPNLVPSELDYVPLDGLSSSAPFKTLGFINDLSASGFVIKQSCNGLMLCKSCPGANVYVYRTYYICNPSRRQYRPIVSVSHKQKKGRRTLSSISLAYDPLKSPHYKVVCIWLVSICSRVVTRPTSRNLDYQIEIYSSETTSWKVSGEVFSKPGKNQFASSVFWNGSLHWIIDTGRLIYFNVDRELKLEMDTPLCDEELQMEVNYFGECKSHLYLIISQVSLPTSFEILEMKTDYTGWMKRYIVSLQGLIIAYPGSESDILLVKEIEGESPNVVLQVGDKVIFYDLQDMSFKEIQQLAPGDRDYVGYQYIQTLACV